MKNLILFGTTAVACAIIALIFWGTYDPDLAESSHDHHHDHGHDHHHHPEREDFLPFSKELVQAHNIEIMEASKGMISTRFKAPAKITMVEDKVVHVLPKVGGIALAAYKNLGQHVEEGEVLAVIESKEIAEAKSNYLTALKKYQLAASIYAREQSLYEKKLTSTQDLNAAESANDKAIINLELSRQNLRMLGIDDAEIENLPHEDSKAMRTYTVRSPIAGQVIARHITPGELLSSDREVYLIADLSQVWAEIDIFSCDREAIARGQSIKILGNRGQSALTKVLYLSPIIEESTRTCKAIAPINNIHGQWLPGSFAQAEFTTETSEVPVYVPKEAIQTLEGSTVVFIKQDDGFTVRCICTGQSDDQCCEVIDGLKPGERYAAKNTFLLKADLNKETAEHVH